jgi:histidine ammonia-lyase
LPRRKPIDFAWRALWGTGPEIADEEIVRAMMVVRANAMIYNAPSPQLSQMLLDLLNKRITPSGACRAAHWAKAIWRSLEMSAPTMVGAGEVYFQGVRMTAEQALQAAPVSPRCNRLPPMTMH